MTALVFTVAAPGAGKSTWVAANFTPGQRVSLDHYRWMVSGDEACQTATPTAVQMMHLVLAERTARGLLTVVDATNATQDIRLQVVAHAHRFGRPAVAVVIHTPIEVCIARQAARRRPTARAPKGKAVPGDVIRRMHTQIDADLAHALSHFGPIIHIAGGQSWRTGYMNATARAALPVAGARAAGVDRGVPGRRRVGPSCTWSRRPRTATAGPAGTCTART